MYIDACNLCSLSSYSTKLYNNSNSGAEFQQYKNKELSYKNFIPHELEKKGLTVLVVPEKARIVYKYIKANQILETER